jgi:hypothetical protein
MEWSKRKRKRKKFVAPGAVDREIHTGVYDKHKSNANKEVINEKALH